MDRLASFSGASVISLSDNELAQLGAFEALQTEARAVLPLSQSMYALNGSTAPVRERFTRCAEAAALGIPLFEQLDMRSAVPTDWHRLR